jgi:ABC-2 type transport system ATP-binding protein
LNVSLPEAVTLIEQDSDWFRYQTDNPMQVNPLVIQFLVNQGIPIVGLTKVPRSLENAYLQAINVAEDSDQISEVLEQASPGEGTPYAG